MNENINPDVNLSNALAAEEWGYVDSCLISPYVSDFDTYASASFFASYAALAVAGQIPFYQVRNRAMVGPMYNNMDSMDRWPNAFKMFSLGVEFVSPSCGNDGAGNPSQEHANRLFSLELPKHCYVVLKIGQDEKLVSTIPLVPSGAGAVGGAHYYDQAVDPSPGITSTNYNNGAALRKNRWEFKSPIGIPRDASVRLDLVFSEEGKEILAAMAGPRYDYAPDQGDMIPAAALIRVSMIGIREVQLRNLQRAV